MFSADLDEKDAGDNDLTALQLPPYLQCNTFVSVKKFSVLGCISSVRVVYALSSY